mmetsp:Transcript_26509/g.47877  ORF Transcript_26509/g.47877 Transcript_26509/m.47877 type:complete len:226 (-) Transcript_26509:122-799(-)|eukprot:CAMPEP_0197644576 /NCGR_PEP_ID=MMETSP1338-20131121/17504_1 /TAXON_ID=43686 ORGANISM="Pelagodinium beii, Strain RCC1491" /NCGR_SAMPLE_ID=MMETSP1338 /ASSEMBLY_ACC=CAM_ASM_000754 /LENGTH=225 /DNA_ID=CAMNT_0043217997 /DNA_START=97 /DNA_END=774 /DNA_ORIENTATION=+
MPAARSSRSHRRGLAVIAAVAFGAPLLAFTGSSVPRTRLERSNVVLEAEAEKTSVALVKVTEESTITTAGVLGGVAGLLLGGIWVGAATFAATSYIARKKDDDVALALKGISTGGLEALNYVDYLNNKYEVTSGVGSSLGDAIAKADSQGTVKESLDSIGDAIANFDKEVNVKDTLGGIFTAGGDLASQAVDKVIELNDKFKVTDQIKEKIDEVVAKSSAGTKSS